MKSTVAKIIALLTASLLLTACAPAEPTETTTEPTTQATTQATTAATTQPTTAPTEPTLPKQNISGTYLTSNLTSFVYTEAFLSVLETSPDRGGALGKYLADKDLTVGALYEFWEDTEELKLITADPVKNFVQTREHYFIVFEAAPTEIIQKERKSGTETLLYSSQQGDITDLGYYGYEDDGELLFVLDHTYIYLTGMPENEVELIYEGNNNIDVVLYFRQKNSIEFRDMNWKFWDYSIDTKELKGPF